MQLAKVLHPAGASAKLASNIGAEQSQFWQDINELKRFVCAFPPPNLRKRTLSDSCEHPVVGLVGCLFLL
jgi:hypothetical protein